MRPKKGPTVIPKYRYSSLVECEEAGNHRVTPPTWPPPKTAQSLTDPVLTLQCELCGAWLVVYEGHATGQLQTIDVILTDEQKRRTKQPA